MGQKHFYCYTIIIAHFKLSQNWQAKIHCNNDKNNSFKSKMIPFQSYPLSSCRKIQLSIINKMKKRKNWENKEKSEVQVHFRSWIEAHEFRQVVFVTGQLWFRLQCNFDLTQQVDSQFPLSLSWRQRKLKINLSYKWNLKSNLTYNIQAINRNK